MWARCKKCTRMSNDTCQFCRTSDIISIFSWRPSTEEEWRELRERERLYELREKFWST